MATYAFSALGRDRPGIVAAITRVFVDHGLNVEDSQMTILRGQFTMTLILGASGPESPPAAVRAALAEATRSVGMEVWSFEPVAETDVAPADPSHIITVYGADHPGIVAAVTGALAEAGVNVTDLNTRLVSDPDAEDLYAMMLEVALPGGMDAAGLEAALAPARSEQGVEVSIRELERDEL
jgi:glycine cleavage system transcriptional repressor